MPSFSDDIFLAILALLLFGPDKLPVLARQLGKWVAEFRRASNEFKMQMEEELRISEQAERQKQIAAMEAAAPQPPALDSTSTDTVEHPHLTTSMVEESEVVEAEAITTFEDPAALQAENLAILDDPAPLVLDSTVYAESAEPAAASEPAPEPLPIATSGSLNMMPPATGLPVARSGANPIEPLLDSIPTAADEATENATDGR